MRKLLLNSVSYPVLNLSNNLASNRLVKQDPRYLEWLAKQPKKRVLAILKGRPYQPLFI